MAMKTISRKTVEVLFSRARQFESRPFSQLAPRFAAASSSSHNRRREKKSPPKMKKVLELLLQPTDRAEAVINQPSPKINLNHVSLSFAGNNPDSKHINTVGTKVNMHFNVRNADWLSEKIRARIMLMEKNRINEKGELVLTSTKTRKQENNLEDVTGKMNKLLAKFQAIIDAASYVPPFPSEDVLRKISKAATEKQKQIDKKESLSEKVLEKE